MRYFFGLSLPKTGFLRNSFALLIGVAGAMTLPPWHFIFLLIPAFSGLYRLARGAISAKRAFFDGWLFGIGYYGASLYWIGSAFLVEAEIYGWMAPIAIVTMSSGLAVFSGLHVWAFRGLFKRLGHQLFLGLASFALIWSGWEWVRSWLFTGFPWNLVGTAWMPFESFLQIASVIGVLGLGFVTVFLAASPALLFEKKKKRASSVVFVSVFLGLLFWMLGAWRLAIYEQKFVDQIFLRLVQPNIPQHLKWKPALRLSHLARLQEMSQSQGIHPNGPTHIIWPETAVPFYLSNSKKLKDFIGTITPKGGLVITGAPRMDSEKDKTWNSIHAVDSLGQVVATYDKFHLVPFGEYVPFRKFLPFTKLVEGRSDFSPGPGPSVLNLPSLPPVLPLICFEAIFFDFTVKESQRPLWILNLTNDAWFGNSAGPNQHLAAAQFRAIESGVPVVRVANTGISAVVNPMGQIVVSAPIGVARVIDTMLPRALKSEPIYTKVKDFLITSLGIFLFAVVALLFSVKERR